MGYIGIIGYILGLYRDNGKENGNYFFFIRPILFEVGGGGVGVHGLGFRVLGSGFRV